MIKTEITEKMSDEIFDKKIKFYSKGHKRE